MDTIDKAINFLRLQDLPYFRVEHNGKLAFKSNESEDGEEGAKVLKELKTEESISLFIESIDLYPEGKYTLIARKKAKGTAGEMRLPFTKWSANANVSGIGSTQNNNALNGFEALLTARLEAQQNTFNATIEKMILENKIKDLEKQVAEKPAFGLDKLNESIAGIVQIMSMSKGLPVAVSGAKPQIQNKANTAASENASTNMMDNGQKTENALERLYNIVGNDLYDGMQGLAAMAEENPTMFKQYLQTLK